MKTKHIYLIRHGQTDYNKMGIVQGSGVDTDLNETGRTQAQAFFEKYKHIPFDRIYTSKLKRAIQSVDGFLKLGIPHESFEGFNEISWGNKDGIKVSQDDKDYYQQVMNEWANGNVDMPVQGGESPVEVLERQIPVINYILSKYDEENILICMHGRAIRILLCYLLGKELSQMDTFDHTNLGLYKMIYEDFEMKLHLANDTAHLSANS
jgi:probable phosphoglycerate mutase